MIQTESQWNDQQLHIIREESRKLKDEIRAEPDPVMLVEYVPGNKAKALIAECSPMADALLDLAPVDHGSPLSLSKYVMPGDKLMIKDDVRYAVKNGQTIKGTFGWKAERGSIKFLDYEGFPISYIIWKSPLWKKMFRPFVKAPDIKLHNLVAFSLNDATWDEVSAWSQETLAQQMDMYQGFSHLDAMMRAVTGAHNVTLLVTDPLEPNRIALNFSLSPHGPQELPPLVRPMETQIDQVSSLDFMARTGQSFITNVRKPDDRFTWQAYPFVEKSNRTSAVGYPFFDHGELLGFLFLTSPKEQFIESDLALVDAVAPAVNTLIRKTEIQMEAAYT